MNKWIEKVTKTRKKLEDDFKKWAEKAEKHYYNDKEDIELPLYHSMVQVQRSALYSQPPVPEIRGRQSEGIDPLSRSVSDILEKAIEYNIDQSDFHSDAKRAVLDFINVDLGVARVRMDTKKAPIMDSDGQPMMSEDGPMEQVASQSVFLDHWPWKRFVYDIGKDWEECKWVCYDHYLTGSELKAEYNYDKETAVKDNDLDGGKTHVFEIWDKSKREVIHLIAGRDKPLRVQKDPLRLKGFFDCYKPMIANMRSDKYIPSPEFKQIEKQLENVNLIEKRIKALTKTVKDVGFYDKSLTELKGLQTLQDGRLLPVDGLKEMLDGATDFSKVVAKLDIVNPANVISVLEQQKKEIKEQIYEITGLSDIVRGATKASETATAQQIKGQWASIRLQDKQSTINSWLKGLLRIMAELIAEHFQPQQLTMTTGIEVTPEITQIMQSDVLRCYAIEVETDSTIQADEAQDKQSRMEMINTIVPLLQNLLPAVQQNMIPADMVKSILTTAVKGYKYARGLEDMIGGLGDNMQQLQQLQQQLQQMQGQAQQNEQQLQMQLQQAGQQIQQLQQELGKVNQQEEQRKNIEVQAEAGKDQAETEKKKAETAQIWQGIQQSQPVNIGLM